MDPGNSSLLPAEKFAEGFGCDALGVLGIIYQKNASFRKLFPDRKLENRSPADVLSGKFRGDKADAQIMPDCRKNHIRGGQLDIRVKLQMVFRKIAV